MGMSPACHEVVGNIFIGWNQNEGERNKKGNLGLIKDFAM